MARTLQFSAGFEDCQYTSATRPHNAVASGLVGDATSNRDETGRGGYHALLNLTDTVLDRRRPIMPEVLETQEIARQAKEFYEAELRQVLEAEHRDEFVAIEPISRTYYLGHTMVEASRQARAMFPNRRSYLMRVGHKSAMQIGWFES